MSDLPALCSIANLIDRLYADVGRWPESLGSGFGLSNIDRLALILLSLLVYGPIVFAAIPLSKQQPYRGNTRRHNPEDLAIHEALVKVDAEQRARELETRRAFPLHLKLVGWLKERVVLQFMKYIALYTPALLLVIMPNWYAYWIVACIPLGWLYFISEEGVRGFIWMAVGLMISLTGFCIWRFVLYAVQNGCV